MSIQGVGAQPLNNFSSGSAGADPTDATLSAMLNFLGLGGAGAGAGTGSAGAFSGSDHIRYSGGGGSGSGSGQGGGGHCGG